LHPLHMWHFPDEIQAITKKWGESRGKSRGL
jgi:hypothetical protein